MATEFQSGHLSIVKEVRTKCLRHMSLHRTYRVGLFLQDDRKAWRVIKAGLSPNTAQDVERFFYSLG